MKPKRVGVLGGVGPMATVYFMQMLLEMTQAECDQDHIDTLVFNHATIPDRTAYILNNSMPSPLPAMTQDAKMLQQAGCDFLVLPCNTAHYFFEKIQQEIEIPLLNIIEEAVAHCTKAVPGVRAIGVLATEGTVQADTYGLVCRRHGLACRYPGQQLQNRVSHIIYDLVKAGKPVPEGELETAIAQMRALGCGAVVLGCTELSVAFRDLGLACKNPDVVDSLEALAESTVLLAGKTLRQ